MPLRAITRNDSKAFRARVLRLCGEVARDLPDLYGSRVLCDIENGNLRLTLRHPTKGMFSVLLPEAEELLLSTIRQTLETITETPVLPSNDEHPQEPAGDIVVVRVAREELEAMGRRDVEVSAARGTLHVNLRGTGVYQQIWITPKWRASLEALLGALREELPSLIGDLDEAKRLRSLYSESYDRMSETMDRFRKETP